MREGDLKRSDHSSSGLSRRRPNVDLDFCPSVGNYFEFFRNFFFGCALDICNVHVQESALTNSEVVLRGLMNQE